MSPSKPSRRTLLRGVLAALAGCFLPVKAPADTIAGAAKPVVVPVQAWELGLQLL